MKKHYLVYSSVGSVYFVHLEVKGRHSIKDVEDMVLHVGPRLGTRLEVVEVSKWQIAEYYYLKQFYGDDGVPVEILAIPDSRPKLRLVR
ncbi:hypothetical protein [Pseudomonas sp. BN515]|uniref:hypothetical protein n=1 Tax=Pseudomonas sp. BN515 TaxID=2567892 RepID=UPI002457B6D8|nr:hypothetical protein [Pseudomonas sp. BN515]MDH4872904.1 hypothetical protein [Pseudomonas sp. BN515]